MTSGLSIESDISSEDSSSSRTIRTGVGIGVAVLMVLLVSIILGRTLTCLKDK